MSWRIRTYRTASRYGLTHCHRGLKIDRRMLVFIANTNINTHTHTHTHTHTVIHIYTHSHPPTHPHKYTHIHTVTPSHTYITSLLKFHV